jgi:hypothetical protein
MSSFSYWPYDEVSLDAKVPGQLTVKTPWIKATTSSAPFNPVQLARLKTKLEDKTLGADDIVLVSDFFRHFHQYPLAYILPRLKMGELLDRHEIKDHHHVIASFGENLRTILIEHGGFTSGEIDQVLSLLPRMAFEWDTDAALDFATIDNRIHPESLFSIARRYHILELLTNDRGQEIFSDIKRQSGSEFVASVAHLVRQNHYVTEQCQASLEPAISLAGQASPLIEEFMAAERGHDKILKKALMHLGMKTEDIAVSVQTRALMAMLQYLAQRNFLSFAMAIDAFERNNYQETDPIAELLEKGGFDKAADFVNLHMLINDSGNHENVAPQFLQFMDLCSRDYGHEALRLMELLSVIMTTISRSAKNTSPKP